MALSESITLTPENGVMGDHGTSQRRQVTLLDEAAWQTACAEIGAELDWTTRRSNILVSNLGLQELVGRQIRVGNTPETRGTAFVVYEDIFDAKNACDHLSGFNVCNRYVHRVYL